MVETGGAMIQMIRCSTHGKNRTPSNVRETSPGSGIFQCLPGSECKASMGPRGGGQQVFETQGQLRGTVHKWVEDRGFGFISPVGGGSGEDVFVHKSAFGGGSLSEGMSVFYDVDGQPQPGQKARAINVSGPAVRPRESAKAPGQSRKQQDQQEQQQQQPQQQLQPQAQIAAQPQVQQQLLLQQPLHQQQFIQQPILQQQPQQQMVLNPLLQQMQQMQLAQPQQQPAQQTQQQQQQQQQQSIQMACPFCGNAFLCPQRGIAVACPHCKQAVQC